MSNTAARFRQGKRPDRNGLRGTTVVLSLVLHLVGFGAAVGLPRLMPRRPPGNAVYVVQLVSLPPGAPSRAQPAPKKAPAPRQTAPKPKTAAPKPQSKVQKPIKVPERTTPKESTAKKPEVKPPQPKPVESEPEPAPPEPAAAEEARGAATDASPATGAAAATGGVGVNVGGRGEAGSGPSDELSFYDSLVERNILRAWNKPFYAELALKTATVYIEVSRSGSLLKIELRIPSGYDPLDRSVIHAVRDAAPFPPFPHFLGLDTLTVQIIFELDPGSLGAGISGE